VFAKERLDKIIDIIIKDGKVIVKELSETFNVSEDAIRKDLKYLEKKGALERTYGGAILRKHIPQFIRVEERVNKNTDAKRKIADKAFSLLKDGEIIFLDISSTNIILAEKIANSDLKLTVISNSIDILHTLCRNPNIQIISPGGILYQNMGGFVGSAAIEAISKYKVQRAFIGSCGVDLELGSINTFNVEDGNTKKAIIKSGKEVILVMENEKFFYDGIYKFADIDEVNMIITDEEPSEPIKSKLEKLKIMVI
jgi:DeoR/GlpR family transcriptional regulator of sugar metabolism